MAKRPESPSLSGLTMTHALRAAIALLLAPATGARRVSPTAEGRPLAELGVISRAQWDWNPVDLERASLSWVTGEQEECLPSAVAAPTAAFPSPRLRTR